MAEAFFLTIVTVVAMCLLFAVWLVRRHGPSALRDAAAYLRAIPIPRMTLPARRPNVEDHDAGERGAGSKERAARRASGSS